MNRHTAAILLSICLVVIGSPGRAAPRAKARETERVGRITVAQPDVNQINSPAELIAHLKAAPWRVEDTDHQAVDPARVRLTRAWHGNHCALRLTNTGRTSLRLGNIILFDLSPHGLSPDTPIYGEAFQMLAQNAGTLGAPVDLGSLPDRLHYRIPEPDGMRTAYGVFALDFGPRAHALLGFASCRRFIGRFSFTADNLRISVDPEGLELAPGETWRLEDFIAIAGPDRGALFETLGKAIRRNHPRLPLPHIPTGWCSWYCYGAGTTEAIVEANMARFKQILPQLQYIQIDDGYSPTEGDWLDPSPAFGDIKASLANISRAGFTPAIWVAPFIAEPGSRVFQEHPDWFVKGPDGRPLDSSTVGFGGWRHGPWYVLDGTNPDAQSHLEQVFHTMRAVWHVPYFKLDANYWGAIHGGTFWDPKATRIEAYRRGMQAILRGAGPDAVILGCNAPIWPSFGLVNAMRTSNDISRSWASIAQTGRENLARAWQNGLLWASDPDAVVLAGADLPETEWIFHATVIHAVGGLVLSGDKAADLKAPQLAILKKLLPPVGRGAEFTASDFAVGVTEQAGALYFHCFNWTDAPVDRTIHLPRPCRLRDYWTGEDLGLQEGDYILHAMPGRSARLIVATPKVDEYAPVTTK